MLIRLDPDKGLISMMSIPRDLKVEIPGVRHRQVQRSVFLRRHQADPADGQGTDRPADQPRVNVDFLGFAQGVYAIGCVYTDVDRRYYHSNVGVPPAEQYAEINVQPGYQLMCGKQALDYVRYRHTDTDIVRSARQQDFLSQARQQHLAVRRTSSSTRATDRRLHRIHDLRHQRGQGTAGSAETACRLAQREDQRGPLPGRTRAQLRLHDRKRDRRRGEGIPRRRDRAGGAKRRRRQSREEAAKPARSGKDKKQAKKKKQKKPQVEAPPSPAATSWSRPAKPARPRRRSPPAASRGCFPIYYPTRLPEGARFVETNPYEKVVDPRVYNLKDEDGDRHAAYRMVSGG